MRFTDMADEMFGAAQGALPALGLAAAVPTAWFVWGVWAEPPLPLPLASPPASSAAWSAPGSAGATTRTSPQ